MGATKRIGLIIAVLAMINLLANQAAGQFHSADTTPDQNIVLGELLRVIQFYNAGGLHCNVETPDGHAPGADPSNQSCPPHDSDYTPQDWRINLSELLRLVQFFNLGTYRTECANADLFAPGFGNLYECGVEGEGEAASEGQPEGEGHTEGEGVPEGLIDGEPEGEGLDEGAEEGTPDGEGTLDGEVITEGELEGAREGAVEGLSEGLIEGVAEGILEGEGAFEGSAEGIIVEGEGALEGSIEGIPEGEGAVEGLVEGAPDGEGIDEGEGTLEGLAEGTAEGFIEGSGDGQLEGEGASEGSLEGISEGEGEGDGEGQLEGQAEGEPPCALVAPPYAAGFLRIDYPDSSRGVNVPVDLYYPATFAGTGAPLAGPACQQFPVVVFGHGYQTDIGHYNFLWQQLIPAGYIVAMVDTANQLSWNFTNFGRDLGFIVEALQNEGTNPASFFHGRVAPRSAVLGHSMGGGATIIAPQHSARITTIVGFAASAIDSVVLTAATTPAMPALMLAAGHDCIVDADDHALPIYNALPSACKHYAEINDGSHCGFSESADTCRLGQTILCPFADFIDEGDQRDHAMQLLRPWLDHHLGQVPNAYSDFLTVLSQQGGAGIYSRYFTACP